MTYEVNKNCSIKDYDEKIEIQENDFYTKIHKDDIISFSKNQNYADSFQKIANIKLNDELKRVINDIMISYKESC